MRIHLAFTALTVLWVGGSYLMANEIVEPAVESAEVALQQRQSIAAMTGRISRDRVRLRNRADRDAPVIMELHKDDLVLIDGLERDFYAVRPMQGMKAYVFRSYILDGNVEASNVNVRLAPSLDATVIGRLQQGERVSGEIAAAQSKWLEIACPEQCRFFVAKEYVEQAGGPDLYQKMGARQSEMHRLLQRAEHLAQQELSKPYDQMRLDEAQVLLQQVAQGFRDFPSHAERAQTLLTKIQKDYLGKKANFLGGESGASVAQEPLALAAVEDLSASESRPITDRMRLWEPVEQGLIESWIAANTNQTPLDYYAEELRTASELEGILEPFASTGTNRPGDYVLKKGAVPAACVYSTSVNLQDQVGRKVRLLASPRPDHHYAFPAYYVHDVEVLTQN
ncbi:MAG: SH3 domain-containing protein [Chlamydiia bacterium]